jgi:hypothetical protein
LDYMKRFYRIVYVLLCFLLPAAALAQGITGQVQDPAGRPRAGGRGGGGGQGPAGVKGPAGRGRGGG